MAQDGPSGLDFIRSWNASRAASSNGVSEEVFCAIFPSYVYLSSLLNEKPQKLAIGAQDCSSEKAGAFTGEVSASTLKEVGASLVLIGHSERRVRGHETNESLRKKLERALEVALTPVFCIGETLEDREAEKVFSVLSSQLEATKGLEAQLILAYEPVWAIGTGKTPSLEQIEEVHAWLTEQVPGVPVVYGGSVKPENAKEILRTRGVRGLLIGGASLKKESFETIVHCALECVQF